MDLVLVANLLCILSVAGNIPFERQTVIASSYERFSALHSSRHPQPEPEHPQQNVTARFADHTAGLKAFHLMVSIMSSFLFPRHLPSLLNTK